jgi:hypothetical protein
LISLSFPGSLAILGGVAIAGALGAMTPEEFHGGFFMTAAGFLKFGDYVSLLAYSILAASSFHSIMFQIIY